MTKRPKDPLALAAIAILPATLLAGCAGGNKQTDADDEQPGWSPDGREIAYANSEGTAGNDQIYVMNADGSNPRPLTHNSNGGSLPVWSPDGRQIAFERGRDTGVGYEIYVMNADGTNQHALTH